MAIRALKVLGVFVLVVALLAGAAVAAVAWGGDRFIVGFIQGHGSTLIGREIRIGGDFHVDWGRPIRITADDVHVANADWGTRPEMFSARHLELEIEPWPLLHFKYVVPRFAMEAPRIYLEKSPDGKGNWQFFAAKQAAPQKRTQFPDLHLFEVSDGVFTWHNGPTKATTEVTFETLKVEAPDTQSPVAIASKGQFQHQRYALQATVGPLAELQDPSKPYPVKLVATLGATRLRLDGSIAEPMDAEGIDLALVLEGKNLADFLTAFSVPLPDTPEYRLAGRLRHSGDRWSIDNIDGRLGKSRLAGGVAVEVGGQVPYIQANLTSSYLDLADLKGLTGAKPEQPRERDAKAAAEKDKDKKKAAQTDDRVIPDTALPVERLPSINVDFALDAPQVKPTGGLPIDRLTLVVALKDGTLELKPVRLGVATGEVRADLRFVSRAKPPDVDGDIDFRHIDLKKLFAGMDVPDQVKELAGIVGGFVKIKSKGASEREILGHADGDVAFFMEGGQFSRLILELMHLDVLESIGWWVQGDKPLPVTCIVARLGLQDGVASTQTFIFDTTEATIEGRGTINLADETIAMDLYPHHKSPVAISFRSPIHIRGTFGKPSVSVDPVTIGAKLAGAIGLGVLAPPAALLPLINVGLGEGNACARAFEAVDDKQRVEDNASGSGSSSAERPSAPPPRAKGKKK